VISANSTELQSTSKGKARKSTRTVWGIRKERGGEREREEREKKGEESKIHAQSSPGESPPQQAKVCSTVVSLVGLDNLQIIKEIFIIHYGIDFIFNR
jgi:hypothetical protein